MLKFFAANAASSADRAACLLLLFVCAWPGNLRVMTFWANFGSFIERFMDKFFPRNYSDRGADCYAVCRMT